MATAEMAGYATEPGRLDVAAAGGELVRVHPSWERLHGLPLPVFVTRAAVRWLPIGDALFAAGLAWRTAPEGYRDLVGFEVEHPRRRQPIGAVIATRSNPIDGMYHVIGLDREGV